MSCVWQDVELEPIFLGPHEGAQARVLTMSGELCNKGTC